MSAAMIGSGAQRTRRAAAMTVRCLAFGGLLLVAATPGRANPSPIPEGRWAGTAEATRQGAPARPGPPPLGLERAAMQRLLAEELARRSGREAHELRQRLLTTPPPELAAQLGIDEAGLRAISAACREALARKMLAAGLIEPADLAPPNRREPPPGE